MRVDVTDLHGVLHAAALPTVPVHLDKPRPGGRERPASSQLSRGFGAVYTEKHIQNFKLFHIISI